MTSEAFLREQDLINNPTTRVPVCLCLDTSGSMDGPPINELNKGVQQFFQELMKDDVARYAAEISVVTFGDTVNCIQDFCDLGRQNLTRTLPAYGGTPMGEALILSLDKLERRKQEYQNAGVDYFQPWLIIMTDGQPNGDSAILQTAIKRASELQVQKKLAIFPIGIGKDADMDVLQLISPARQPLRLKGLKFEEFFLWLSRSVSRTSQSMPGEEIKLDMSGISSWATL
jgi:uncharacterized protein YegL